jgi:hypothetical protein
VAPAVAVVVAVTAVENWTPGVLVFDAAGRIEVNGDKNAVGVEGSE